MCSLENNQRSSLQKAYDLYVLAVATAAKQVSAWYCFLVISRLSSGVSCTCCGLWFLTEVPKVNALFLQTKFKFRNQIYWKVRFPWLLVFNPFINFCEQYMNRNSLWFPLYVFCFLLLYFNKISVLLMCW